MMVWKTIASRTPARRVRVKASSTGTDSSVSTGPAMARTARGPSLATVGSPNEAEGLVGVEDAARHLGIEEATVQLGEGGEAVEGEQDPPPGDREPGPGVGPGECHQHRERYEAHEQPVVARHRQLQPHRQHGQGGDCPHQPHVGTDEQHERRQAEKRRDDRQPRRPAESLTAPPDRVADQVRDNRQRVRAREPPHGSDHPVGALGGEQALCHGSRPVGRAGTVSLRGRLCGRFGDQHWPRCDAFQRNPQILCRRLATAPRAV